MAKCIIPSPTSARISKFSRNDTSLTIYTAARSRRNGTARLNTSRESILCIKDVSVRDPDSRSARDEVSRCTCLCATYEPFSALATPSSAASSRRIDEKRTSARCLLSLLLGFVQSVTGSSYLPITSTDLLLVNRKRKASCVLMYRCYSLSAVEVKKREEKCILTRLPLCVAIAVSSIYFFYEREFYGI